MGGQTSRNGAYVGLFLTVAALTVCGLGVFSESWWRDPTGNTYSVFTVINCTDFGCTLGDSDNEGWVVFAQASGVLSFLLLSGSLLLQLINQCSESRPLIYAMASLLGLSCLLSLLHTFVVIAKYHQLTKAYVKQIWLPKENGVVYQTLPVGLIAVSGSLCVPACIAIMIYRMKQMYDYKTDPKNPNRLV